MFERWMRMVAAPESAEAGAGGGGSAPAAGVRSPAPPAGDGNPFPLITQRPPAPPNGSERSPAAGGGADSDDLEAAIAEDHEGRGIPHERVRAMRASWEKKAREAAGRDAEARAREALIQEFTPILEELQQYRELRTQMDPSTIKAGIAESILAGLGVQKKPPEPKYLTEEEFAARMEKLHEKQTREIEHRNDVARAHQEMQAAKAKHKTWFEHFPVLEELGAAVWGSPHAYKNKIPMAAIIDGLVAQLEKGIGGYNEAYQKAKAEGADEQVLTPAPGPGPKTPPKKKVDNSDEGVAKRAIEFLSGRQKT